MQLNDIDEYYFPFSFSRLLAIIIIINCNTSCVYSMSLEQYNVYKILITITLLGSAAISSASTLLVDFVSGDNNPQVASNAADFTLIDPAVASEATVTQINADSDIKPVKVDSGVGLSATVDIIQGTGYSAKFGAIDGLAILDGYLTIKAHKHAIINVFGFKGVSDGDIITITLYGIGDRLDQTVNFTIFNGKIADNKVDNAVFKANEEVATTLIKGIPISDTDTTSPDKDTSQIKALTAASSQLTFAYDSRFEAIQIVVDGSSQYSCLNGFSMTVAPVE